MKSHSYRALLVFYIVTSLLVKTSVDAQQSESGKLLAHARKVIPQLSLAEVNPGKFTLDGFSFGDSRKDVKDIINVISDRKEDIRLKRLALAGLKNCKSVEAQKELSQLARNWKNYNELSVQAFKESDVIPEFIWPELIDRGDPIIAQVAVEYLNDSLLGRSEIRKSLTKKIEDKKAPYYLRAACIEKLQRAPLSKKILECLVRVLQKDNLGKKALNILKEATGKDYGYEARRWNHWLSMNDEGSYKQVTPPPSNKPLIELASQTVPPMDDYPDRYKNEHSQATLSKDTVVSFLSTSKNERYWPEKSLYGIDIKGQNLLFFLDCSGSMSGEPFRMLKDQMLYMAKTLGDSYSIGVVFFPFNRKSSILKPAQNTRAFQSKLKRFLSRQKTGGGTSLIGAMDYSYDHLISRYSTVDTIYVISDGAIGNPNERAMVYTLNAEDRIRINTISIRGRSDFMTGLAMDNFGSSFMVQ